MPTGLGTDCGLGPLWEAMERDQTRRKVRRAAASRALLVAGLVAIVVAVIYGGSKVAGAAEIDSADSVVDYAGYPANEVGPDCDATDITGVEFSLNGGPAMNARALPNLRIGDRVTMTWTDVGGCAGEWVSLAIKEAPGETFDPTADQRLLTPYARELAVAGGGSVTLPIVQPILVTCFYQLDGILGRPLATVGPSGSYYSSSFSGSVVRSDERSMLLGASNGQVPDCTPTTTPTPTTAPPTTEPPTTVPPTTGATTTVAVTVPDVPGSSTTVDSGVLTSSVGPRASLPATGGNAQLVRLAVILIAAGVAVMALRYRRMNR